MTIRIRIKYITKMTVMPQLSVRPGGLPSIFLILSERSLSLSLFVCFMLLAQFQLILNQFIVYVAFFYQFVVRACFGNTAFIQHYNLVGMPDG